MVSITLLLLNLGESSPGTHGTKGWVCQRAALNISEKRRNLLSLPGIEQQFLIHPAYRLVTVLTTLSQLFTSFLLPLLFLFHLIFPYSLLYAIHCNQNMPNSMSRETYKCKRRKQKGTGFLVLAAVPVDI